MVTKVIVVRNLFSYEYDGSNPSLPTKIHSVSYVFFLLKRWIRKGSCRALSRSGADQSEGKNSPVDYFSDAARRNPSLPTKHITYVMCFFMLKDR